MELESLQARAGHRSLDTTRLYIHLANGWLADEYDKASEVIDAEIFLAAADGVGQLPLSRSPSRPCSWTSMKVRASLISVNTTGIRSPRRPRRWRPQCCVTSNR